MDIVRRGQPEAVARTGRSTHGEPAGKAELYEQFARVGKALASPKRLELLDLLAQGERSVEDLAGEAGLGLSTCSAHLQVLHHARLVTPASRGPASSTPWPATTSPACMRGCGRWPPRCWPRSSPPAAPTWAMTWKRCPATNCCAASARARSSCSTSAPPPNTPPGTSPARSPSRSASSGSGSPSCPTGTEVVAYCRGPYCVFAHDAVRLLRAQGRTARRLAGGMPEWRLAGLPVAAGGAVQPARA